MQIEYEISEQDFLDGQRLGIRKHPRRAMRWFLRIVPFWGVFLVIAVVWNLLGSGLEWNNGMTAPLVLGVLRVRCF